MSSGNSADRTGEKRNKPQKDLGKKNWKTEGIDRNHNGEKTWKSRDNR